VINLKSKSGLAMAENNNLTQRNLQGKKRLIIALVIILTILVVEFIGGFLSNSLSLMGDAAHMLVDALALGLSLFAINVAAKPATAEKTYGFHRAEIIVALVNGIILILISLFIFYQAYNRFMNPPDIQAPIMLVVAAIGLVANICAMLVLRNTTKSNLNLKAAFWHIIGDAVSSLGVIIAAIIIFFTGFQFVDAVIAILIGGIIIWGASGLIKESINVLLEAVPKNIKNEDVVKAIEDIEGVIDIHEMHIWSITTGVNSLSAHIVIEDRMLSDCNNILQSINDMLKYKFDIIHTTLQLECGNCTSGLVCNINPVNLKEKRD
jgi:cobalt-zinc-cadmium efflux system protein